MENTDTIVAQQAMTKRQLILRDSLTFFSLALLSLLLFAATLFLFHSFTVRRAMLARRWLDRGRAALAASRPAEAVDALRVTMDYAPDDRDTKFLLATALRQSGHAEEASNYLTELWDTQPGSGVINLERARIAAHEDEEQQAIDFYRAAIYGTWEGDGIARRREIRLELAEYLLQRADADAARSELIIASGNVSGDAQAEVHIAQLLERAGDPSNARRLYLRAAGNPQYRVEAFTSASGIDFRDGDFASAQKVLREAAATLDQQHVPDAPAKQQITARLHLVNTVLALSPSSDVSEAERVRRILQGREIARARLERCQPHASQPATPEVASLTERWSARGALPDQRSLLRSKDLQQSAIELNQQTEEALSHACSTSNDQPTIEDQALLLLAKQKRGNST